MKTKKCKHFWIYGKIPGKYSVRGPNWLDVRMCAVEGCLKKEALVLGEWIDKKHIDKKHFYTRD